MAASVAIPEPDAVGDAGVVIKGLDMPSVTEFSVSMPNLIHTPPQLEKFPVVLQNSLSFLAQVELPEPRCVADGSAFLPPRGSAASEENLLTLVLDLDETLVHCRLDPLDSTRHSLCVHFEERPAIGYVYVRPFAHLFLEIAARLFEVVIFTASSRAYADQVLDYLDPEGKHISKRLYRQHCTELKGAFLKDIHRLGRPMDRVVLVDNSPISLAMCPDNGILISSWRGEKEGDRELMDLLLLLQQSMQSQSASAFLVERFGFCEFLVDLRRWAKEIIRNQCNQV